MLDLLSVVICSFCWSVSSFSSSIFVEQMLQEEEVGARTLKEKSKSIAQAFQSLPKEEVSGVAREGDLPPQLWIHPWVGDHLQAGILGLGQEEAVVAAHRPATAQTPPGARASARCQQGHLAAHRYKG